MYKIYSYLAYLASKWAFLILLKVFFRFKVEGAENMPSSGAFILASNHVSYMDPGIVGAIAKRRLYFITSDHLYRNKLAAFWHNSTGCIRIRRGESDHAAIRKILGSVKAGKPIAIFPEGTRSPDGKLKDAFSGIGFLALKTQVPVVPCFIKGSDSALPRGARFFKFGRVSVTVGSPILPETFSGNAVKKEAYRSFSKKVMDSIAELDKIK